MEQPFVKYLLMVMILLTTSCSISSFYPAAGATAGASLASLSGNPLVGAAGGLAGYSAGKAAQVTSDHKETIQALSKGDVSELVKQGLVQAKADGFFDSLVGEFYGLLKLACIILICWNALPLLYTYLLKREVKKNGITTKA